MPRLSAIARSIAAVSLIVTMMGALAVTGSAQTGGSVVYPENLNYNVSECYFASVSNGEDFGLGASKTSITVQNLSGEAGTIYIYRGASTGFVAADHASLEPYASKTFSAAQLGIAPGTTVPVAVAGYKAGSTNDYIAIGCVAKQAVGGNNLPATTAADSSVSGYNATSGREIGYHDDLYLPIAQTNCGPGGCWDTIIRVANVGAKRNSAVTIRFFPAASGGGSLSTGFQTQALVSEGQVVSFKLSDLLADQAGGAQGWVGSVHIYGDDTLVAIADRFKVGTDMWITNTASSAPAESELQGTTGIDGAPYVLYAPDVRLDFNGWNTGISVANTVDMENAVDIQYFGSSGNAPQAQSRVLSAQGMTYFYNPSSPSEDSCSQPAQQVGLCDFVGGALIWSEYPVAAAVDGVKYFGNDANVGQAFSYNATGNAFQFQAAPLMQKGSPSTGMGATSGVTFMNPNTGSTFVWLDWYNADGSKANRGRASRLQIPGFATGFIYTMTQENLPNGFTGSAFAYSTLPVVGSSPNVDYQVSGDGTALYTLYNPCGVFRQLGGCEFAPAPDPLATKNFDVRPLGIGAWICVYPATDGQDGKPIPPTGDCKPEYTADYKVDTDGGQGGVVTYVANLGAGGLIQLTVDNNLNTMTATRNGLPLPAGLQVFVENWARWDGGAIVPANTNMACTDTEPPFDGYFINSFEIGEYDGAERAKLGNFSNAIVRIGSDCGQIEMGRVRLETPQEMKDRLGTLVPPFQPGPDGKASIQLPAGCYFFVVSADGYVTQITGEECLASGEVVLNTFDLVPPPPPTFGTLTKTFCASVVDGQCNGPISELDVTLTNVADPSITYHLAPQVNGTFYFGQVQEGTYELCWTDESDPLDDVAYVEGCETINVVGNTVVVNDITLYAFLDVCVRNEENNNPFEGASVIARGTATNVAYGPVTTDAVGQARLQVLPGHYSVTAYYPDTATTSTGEVTMLEGDGFDTCLPNGTGGDILLGLDPNMGSFEVLVQMDPNVTPTPVPGTRVWVYTASGTDSATECNGSYVADALTNADGIASFELEAGNYCVIADPNRNGVSTAAQGTVEINDPSNDVDATISELPVADIFAYMPAGGTNPIAGVYVTLTNATANSCNYNAPYPGQALTGADGQVQFEVDSGWYCATGDVNGDGVQASTMPFQIVSLDYADDVDSTLSENPVLDVLVNWDGQPAAGVEVRIWNMDVAALVCNAAVVGVAYDATGTTNADGEVAFVTIPGNYCVGANVDGEWLFEEFNLGATNNGSTDKPDVVFDQISWADAWITYNGAPLAAGAEVTWWSNGFCGIDGYEVATGVSTGTNPISVRIPGATTAGETVSYCVSFEIEGQTLTFNNVEIEHRDPLGDHDFDWDESTHLRIKVLVNNDAPALVNATWYSQVANYWYPNPLGPGQTGHGIACPTGIGEVAVGLSPSDHTGYGMLSADNVPAGTYCVQGDPNNDGTTTSVAYNIPIGNDIKVLPGDYDALLSEGLGQGTIDLTLTFNGIAPVAAQAPYYVQQSVGGVCEPGIVAAGSMTSAQLSGTAWAGSISLPMGDYCVWADTDNDGVFAQSTPVTVTVPSGGTVAAAVDEVTGLGVQVGVRDASNPSVILPLQGIGVTVYTGDNCTTGELVPTIQTDQHGQAFFFTGIAVGGTYWVRADANNDGVNTCVGPVTLPAGNQGHNIDVVVVENMRGTLRILTTVDGNVSGSSPYIVYAATGTVCDTSTIVAQGNTGPLSGNAEFFLDTGNYCVVANTNGDALFSPDPAVMNATITYLGTTVVTIDEDMAFAFNVLTQSVERVVGGPNIQLPAPNVAFTVHPWIAGDSSQYGGDNDGVCASPTVLNQGTTDANGLATVQMLPGSYCIGIPNAGDFPEGGLDLAQFPGPATMGATGTVNYGAGQTAVRVNDRWTP